MYSVITKVEGKPSGDILPRELHAVGREVR